VSSKAISAAKKEALLIRQSRRQNNLWNFAEVEQAAIVLESCKKSFLRFLEGSVSEWELRELMDAAQKADRAKMKLTLSSSSDSSEETSKENVGPRPPSSPSVARSA